MRQLPAERLYNPVRAEARTHERRDGVIDSYELTSSCHLFKPTVGQSLKPRPTTGVAVRADDSIEFDNVALRFYIGIVPRDWTRERRFENETDSLCAEN